MAKAEPKFYTWEQYAKLPEDGCRYEVLEGYLVREPAPSFGHQKVSWILTSMLESWRQRTGDRGEFAHAPADVELGKYAIVQPDLLYVSAERAPQLISGHVRGAPDLVVEIYNRAAAARDTVTKLQMYAKYGIREYWLIDLEQKSVMMLELSDGIYRAFAQGEGEDVLESRVLPGFTLTPARIF
ncbi:MAG: Uma2 family endonuclease [Candidatus Wallbacteria bacterium]|nr:Uma2 family endonuclease [Candidatus Wallbacteria bacterium]